MAASNFFSPLKLGPFTLPNRIVMAPLTRCRATPAGLAQPHMATHYAARASAGLLIAEATLVSAVGRGFPCTPGIHTAAQAEAWQQVTKAVHAKGGRIFVQLWHQGRTASAALNGGHTPVAPSAVDFIDGYGNPVAAEASHALTTEEVGDVVAEYRAAARLALEAGFDGVELHAANGYLPNQFLVDGANVRSDQYGGSIANRCRFPLEVMAALVEVVGAERVGIRISPSGHWQGIADSDPVALYAHLARELQALGPLAYLHVVEPRDAGFGVATSADDLQLTAHFFKQHFTGPILSAGGHDYASGAEYLAEGKADAIVYGRAFVSTPDLVERFQLGAQAKPNRAHRDTFYTHDPHVGYNDYPLWGDDVKQLH